MEIFFLTPPIIQVMAKTMVRPFFAGEHSKLTHWNYDIIVDHAGFFDVVICYYKTALTTMVSIVNEYLTNNVSADCEPKFWRKVNL